MKVLSLLYAAPAVLFLVICGLWYLNRGLPRLLAAIPVIACYAVAAVLLILGGCNPVAHVTLEGVEVDLVDGDGKLREISLGGSGDIPSLDGIEIPGYPQDALRLRLDLDKRALRLVPGTGYQRGLLVRTGEGLLPLENSRLPRLEPLQHADVIRLTPQAGGRVLAQWRLGDGKFDLKPGSAASPRWIGSQGTGLARLQNAPAQMIALRANGMMLEINRGPGLAPNQGVLVNGIRLAFDANGRAGAYYQPGTTVLALVDVDVAAGDITLQESGFMGRHATLHWKSMLSQPPGYSRTLKAGQTYRLGGAVEDDLFVRGLPAGALELEVKDGGAAELRLTRVGEEAHARHEFAGNYPQRVEKAGAALRIGIEGDPSGGILLFENTGAAAPATALEVTAVDDESATPAGASPGPAPDDSADISVPTPPATPVVAEVNVVWIPNIRTNWKMPNREITLPFIDHDITLWHHRPWAQRVFPLAAVTPLSSNIRSCIVYGQEHPALVNGANLLLLEPGVSVWRSGEERPAPSREPGLLPLKGGLDFLHVTANEQGRRWGAQTISPWAPVGSWEALRVVTRKRFSHFDLGERIVGNKRRVPILTARFIKPVTQSLPLADVKDALKEVDKNAVGVSFGLNDLSGFSQLPHQVRFRELSSWFASANADVTLNWLDFTAQDDFHKQKLSYGEAFQVGGDRRLLLSVVKHTRPWPRIFAVAGAGLVALLVCAWGAGSLSWVALMFGVSFLSCSRVIFGQAAEVNPPYHAEVMQHALVTLWAAPLLLGAVAFFGRHLLPGKLERLIMRVEKWVGYRRLALLALAGLGVRLGLLFGGFKEAIPLGPVRLALSIGFVPFYLLLFSFAIFVLWRGKLQHGWLDWKQMRPFILCTLWLALCQGAAAALVSDLGLMLYFMPQALVLATIGVVAGIEGFLRWLRQPPGGKQEHFWQVIAGTLLPLAPLALISTVFLAPQFIVGVLPGLSGRLSDSDDLVTDSTLLRVLQFVDKDYLINLGTDSAERIAQDHAIMNNYAHRGLVGEGYLQVHITPAKYVTALNDNVSAVFVLAQFGTLGGISMIITYLAIASSSASVARHEKDAAHACTSWIALTAGLSFCFVSLFMIGANFGLLPFTGRNMYLLGLNSWSDVIESMVLLAFIALHHARSSYHEKSAAVRQPAQFDLRKLIGQRSFPQEADNPS